MELLTVGLVFASAAAVMLIASRGQHVASFRVSGATRAPGPWRLGAEEDFRRNGDRDINKEFYSPILCVSRSGRALLKRCQVFDPVRLVPEFGKRKGSLGVAVLTQQGDRLGYLPDYCIERMEHMDTSKLVARLWRIEISECCMEVAVLLQELS